MNRRQIFLLSISIILNVLFAGVLLGHVSRDFIALEATPPSSSHNVASLLAQFSPEHRALFDSMMNPAIKKMEDERKQMDAAKLKAVDILKMETFDSAAYLAQVQRINEIHDQMKMHAAEAVITFSRELTSQERTVLAELISNPPFSVPRGWLTKASPPIH